MPKRNPISCRFGCHKWSSERMYRLAVMWWGLGSYNYRIESLASRDRCERCGKLSIRYFHPTSHCTRIGSSGFERRRWFVDAEVQLARIDRVAADLIEGGFHEA